MFGKKNFKKIIITLLALTMVLGTVALAADSIYTKQLKATYGRIKFSYEGTDVTSQIENKYGTPAFVADERAYAPVRAIADLLGVDIEYDHDTHTAEITDTKVKDYKLELAEKNVEIANLKADITKLENQVKELEKEDKKEEEKEPSKTDIKALEASLNKEYGRYREVDFDIALSQTGNKVSVAITTDFINARNEYYWSELLYNNYRGIDYMVGDIVDQVRKNLDKPDITGYVYDVYNKEYLYDFSQTSKGSLTTSPRRYTGVGDGYRLGHSILDSYVNSEFENHDIFNTKLYELSYDRVNQRFEILIPENYRYEWNKISRPEENVLYNISREIERNYYSSNYNYITIDVLIGGTLDGTYTKYYDDYFGTYRLK